jgi:signal transduction histidine kinase
VKRIAEEHHGTVTVESSPGRGCCFIVRLPLNIRRHTPR